jgi:hypothetical protein
MKLQIPLTTIEFVELKKKIKQFDILLVKEGNNVGSKLISFGQKSILKQVGITDENTEFARHYVHVMQITDVHEMKLIEAVVPKIKESPILKYAGRELIWLRLTPKLNKDEIVEGKIEAYQWLGHTYDLFQYFTYPLIIVFGKVSKFWCLLWDDEDDPVCSDLVLKISQKMNRLMKYKDHLLVCPARFLFLDNIKIMGRIIIEPSNKYNLHIEKLPWWLQ